MVLKRIAISMLLTTSLIGCKTDENEIVSAALTDTVESGLSSLVAVIDDANGSSFIAARRRPWDAITREFGNGLFPLAHAAVCARASAQSCSGAVKTGTYADCTIGTSAYTLSGSVTLTFSSGSVCSGGLAADGDSVTRTYDYTITGPSGASLRVFSSARTNYEGTSISGGGRLTRTAAGYDVEILGKNKVLSNGARELFDHSVKTTSAVQVLGGLARATRILDGGAIEVYHNRANFKASHVPNQLQFSASCCYPVSGSITTSLSGSITGGAVTTFTGCGQATVGYQNRTRDITFSYCE